MKLNLLLFSLVIVFLASCKEVQHRNNYGNLIVLDNNDNTKVLPRNRGDEVMLGAIYFTSQFGSPDSTRVSIRPIRKLADNLDPSETVSAQYLNFAWSAFETGLGGTDLARVKSYVLTPEEFASGDIGPTVTGVAIIAVEEDNIGDGQLNTQLNSGASNLYEGLKVFVESDAYKDLPADERSLYILGALNNAQDYKPGASGGLSGGGYDGNPITILSQLFFGIPLDLFGNLGHDLIEVSAVIKIGVEQGVAPLLDIPFQGCVANFTPGNLEICPLTHNGLVTLQFAGADAIWSLDIGHIARVID